MLNTKNTLRIPIIVILVSIVLYYYLGYHLPRENFLQLFSSYVVLFLGFIVLVKTTTFSSKQLLGIGVLFRILLLLAIPFWSQDFYRFIWDGRMFLNGFNPYLYLPENYLSPDYILPNQAEELFLGMGELNASHYTNYPPLNQLCFLISALFSKNSILGSVIVFKVIIILADIGTTYYGEKLLTAFKMPSKLIFLYFLNPFIIIELTGNLHFEGVMIFFLILSLYLLQLKKWIGSAFFIACSIALKLIPLLFLPLFFQQFKLKKLIAYYSIVMLCIALFFLPFIDENFINNYSRTIGLWFGQFEFNGSIYQLAKAIGYKITGYNTIKTIGKITPILVIITTLGLAFLRKNKEPKQLVFAMLMTLSFYLFTSTTVHPWYLAMLLILGIFSNYKFPLVWSLTIILSYQTYTNINFKENSWILLAEYCIVYGLFIWEVFFLKKEKLQLE